jgi:hypothetical protein
MAKPCFLVFKDALHSFSSPLNITSNPLFWTMIIAVTLYAKKVKKRREKKKRRQKKKEKGEKKQKIA